MLRQLSSPFIETAPNSPTTSVQPFPYSPSKFPRPQIPIPSPIIHLNGEAKAGPGRSAVRPPAHEMNRSIAIMGAATIIGIRTYDMRQSDSVLAQEQHFFGQASVNATATSTQTITRADQHQRVTLSASSVRKFRSGCSFYLPPDLAAAASCFS
jgi:hypothetical protein